MGRTILSISAGLLFVTGAAGLFGADELSRSLFGGAAAGEPVIQVAAAGLLGFAVVNWLSRGNRIGGIYMRPLALGNLLLSTVAGLSLAKAVSSGELPTVAIGPALAFCGMAIAFGWLTFWHDPLSAK